MKMAFLCAPLMLAVAAVSTPAAADQWHHHHGNWGHAHVSGDAFLIGAGIVVGAVALGALLSPPPPYVSPRISYYPPPRSCVQDEVYRFLPDGRIQTGTRTTCY